MEERVCHLCGCEESAHGGTKVNEDGDTVECCTGCNEECEFEPEEEDEAE